MPLHEGAKPKQTRLIYARKQHKVCKIHQICQGAEPKPTRLICPRKSLRCKVATDAE